ncbi:MAG: insulinase family protein [Deltaproteobacteria bacterium]|nr:insulinase family protein [Deltaproteobacteria bacterium]MBW2128072.1 insulinase family protein [Deltaproteobacteria bacterium]
MRPLKKLIAFFFLFLVIAQPQAVLGSSRALNLDVKEFTLKNGMLFLVVERHSTPQVACRLAIRAGSALEDRGKTGIAHLLEHMMFKGTNNFGTLDPERDRRLQEQIEAAYQIIRKEEQKRNPDRSLIRAKKKEMNRLRLEVQKIFVPQAFSSQLARNGAVGVNAFTTKDQTQFKASVPSDMIEQWFSIVSEQIFEPSWREFYVEKEVVQREWAYRYVNNPGGAAWLDLYATAYTAHPYRSPVIGWKSDMEWYSTADAVAFHRKYYNPANAVCVLVGDVTLERARKLAEIYFGRYPAGERAPERVTREPEQEGPRRSVRYLKGARTPLLRIGFHGAAMGTRDFYALDALTMVLSRGRSARLTREIVDKGLAASAWAYNPDNRYGGLVILGGTPNEPEVLKNNKSLPEKERREAYLKACEDLETLLLSQLDRMRTEPVLKRELERIKKLNYRDFLDRMRSNEELAGTLATIEVQIGWRYLLDYLDEISKVTPEDIRRVARKYLVPEKRTTVFVIPGGRPERPPEPYEEVRSLSRPEARKALGPPGDFTNHSRYPTPPGWKHPLSFDRRPEKICYPKAQKAQVGGATLFYLPDHELPLIDIAILVKAGSVDVADSSAGLTQLLEETLVRGGTDRLTPRELAEELDDNAIHLTVSVREEESVIRLSVMKEDWKKGLSLLGEVLTRPRFDSEILDVARNRILTALKRQGGNARAVSSREARIWHFKGHPYGRDPLLALKTLPRITREDLRRFLETYFTPSNMVVTVAGDIGRERVVKDMEDFLKEFPKNAPPVRKLGTPEETPPVLALIHKPGQVQSQVIMMLPGVRRINPDYWKINLLMDVFGGSDSLLYKRLRDDLGLVYAAAFFETYRWEAGMLMGYIGCKGDKTSRAVEETIRIMESLRSKIPEQDVEQKRLDILNSFVFNVDSPTALVEVYGRYQLRGEPLDTLERIQDVTMKVKREELEGLAKKFLDPSKIQVFVVADKTTPVVDGGGKRVTLEEDLKALAKRLGLPYRELPLR